MGTRGFFSFSKTYLTCWYHRRIASNLVVKMVVAMLAMVVVEVVDMVLMAVVMVL